MENLKNMKVSIGLVIAIIVQAFGLIWYVAQLDSNVTSLNDSVSSLQEQATTVDVAVLQKDLENIKEKILMMDEMHSMKFDPSELEEAIDKKDIKEVADALTDILYVTYGAGHAFGINLDKCFEEVQNSNMSKLGSDGKPIYNEQGKVMKGPDYFKPNLNKFVA